MSQQNIDFGTFPDDPDADAIRTAFAKVQNNFDELFATATAGSVASINGGAGITASSPTGNVIVTANLAQVVVNTSSLSIGRGSNGGTTATLTTSAQILVIDINPANVFSNNFAANSTGALANFTGTLTTNSNSQPNITSVGTLTSLAVTGNITAGNVYANSGTIGAANLTGSLTTAAQGNITSVGVLTGLSVNGTVTAVAFTANTGVFTGDGGGLSNLSVSAGSTIVSGSSNVKVELNSNVNVTVAGVANIVTFTSTGSNVNGYLTVTGNVTSGNANLGNAATANYFIGNLHGPANTANTVTTNAQPNITSVGTLTSLNVSGNITSGNVYANSGIIKAQYLQGDGSNLTNLSAGIILVNGNSNVSIPTTNGNINMSAVGNANVVVITGTGVNVAGTINATGTITGNFSGNVTTAVQGNITSLGTLTGLTVNGTANLGAVGNVKITGSTGFLQSDGAGNLSFSSVITQTIPGAANAVLLSSGSNSISASGNIKFNDPQLAITGTLSVTGNANVGNLGATLITGTLTTASNNQSNIKLLGTLDYLIINTTGYLSMGSGNITAGNIALIAAGSANLGNSVTANYFIGSGNNLSNIQGSNVTGAVSSATSATNASALLQNTSSATTVYPTFTTSSANGNSSAVFNTSISANLANASITATTFVGALSGTATFATTANSVAGANVSGAVAFATTANSVAGGNVSGAVAFATTANSVAGGNVSGAVGLATFATTANSVAGANVSGAVAFATTANSVAGGNVSGAVSFATTANSVAGGNVSGTVSSASTATTAGSTTTVTLGGSVTTTTITTGANTTAGTITGNWSLSAGSQLRATYADLAEYYAASEKIEPGTVVEFGGEHEVQICNSYMSTLVTGIVTTDPAYIMNDGIECEYPVAIALQGRVPAKVIGPVKRGDMMVSANDGHAISCKSPSMGTVLGKALTDFNGEIGMIEIMVGRT